ncbi:MAG: hypothetical protein IJ022_04480 [Burkholderiaceae bacterium]|nr:hypothetical protein [Burkholderiaceae bacterium]
MNNIQEDIFQIALVNHRPADSHYFDWQNFSAERVVRSEDLPPYLIFGNQDKDAFCLTADGWSALWCDKSRQNRILLTWNRKTGRFTVNQTWRGIEGSSEEVASTESLNTVLSSLYSKGFPVSWDTEAKDHFEKLYQLSWVKSPEELPIYFGVPDGVFYSIIFPVMVKNIRNAKKILEDVAKEPDLDYGFFATACMLDQKVLYKVGQAPEWTQDVAQVLTQSLGETGLMPLEIPELQEDGLSRAVKLERSVMTVVVSVPFGRLEDMLSRLAETPMPILSRQEPPHRRETLPIVVPVNISEDGRALRIDDQEQGISSIYQFLEEKSLGELLQLDADRQIQALEELSDQLVEQLISATKQAGIK